MTRDTATLAETKGMRGARLRRELAALIVELELLAEWARRMEARQARLEVLAAALEAPANVTNL